MTKALLRVRFRALFGSMLRQSRLKKKRSTGLAVLLVFLLIYAAAAFCFLFGITFQTLAPAYHQVGLDWLYFATAGLMALALAVFGSVFATQSQLYDAKDNELLLAMPIPPRLILLSRMIPLLALNLLFALIVLLPAGVVFGMEVGFSPLGLAAFCLCALAVVFLAQALECLLGWLLHQLLSRMNKTMASLLYMVLFFAVYFSVYSQAGNILNAMAAGGEAMAGALRSWAWPLYAMGMACTGELLLLAAFLAITVAFFGVIYWFLSVTFLRSATMRRSGRKRRQVDLNGLQAASPAKALGRKELRRFLGCPAYVTNLGMGVILIVALAVVGVIFRGTVLGLFDMLPGFRPYTALILCGALGSLIAMTCISTPSVSLEGKNLWILKSLPLTGSQILKAKLNFHCLLVVPVSIAASLALTLAFGCGAVDVVLSALVSGLLGLLCGLFGLICGLQWARLDWISEAYPCKQSLALLVTMLGLWGFVIVLGLLYGFLLAPALNPPLFLGIVTGVLALVNLLLYRALLTWGVKKWEAL